MEDFCVFFRCSNRRPGCRISMFLWKCKMPGDFWWEWVMMKCLWMESHSLRGLEHASYNIYQTICRGWLSTQNSTRDSQPTCLRCRNFVLCLFCPFGLVVTLLATSQISLKDWNTIFQSDFEAWPSETTLTRGWRRCGSSLREVDFGGPRKNIHNFDSPLRRCKTDQKAKKKL